MRQSAGLNGISKYPHPKWTSDQTVDSKCLQVAVRHIYSIRNALKSLKSKGDRIGKLK